MPSYIAPLHYQLTIVHSPFDKETYCALSNTTCDDSVRVGTDFTSNELSLFFGIVQDLLEYSELLLTDVQNMGPEFRMRVADAAQAVQKFHQRQWLKVVRRTGMPAKVVFGARSLLELPDVRAWAVSKNVEQSDKAEQIAEKAEEALQGEVSASQRSSGRAKRKHANGRGSSSQRSSKSQPKSDDEEVEVVRPRRRRRVIVED